MKSLANCDEIKLLIWFPFHVVNGFKGNVGQLHFIDFILADADHFFTDVNSFWLGEMVGELEEHFTGSSCDVEVVAFAGDFFEGMIAEFGGIFASK